VFVFRFSSPSFSLSCHFSVSLLTSHIFGTPITPAPHSRHIGRRYQNTVFNGNKLRLSGWGAKINTATIQFFYLFKCPCIVARNKLFGITPCPVNSSLLTLLLTMIRLSIEYTIKTGSHMSCPEKAAKMKNSLRPRFPSYSHN
jgi:hypothetical protein